MKKKLLLINTLFIVGISQAQIQINGGTNNGIANSNVMIDGSTAFSNEAGAQPNTGKGIVIPSVNLVNFEFDLTLADGVTFPSYFDGMIVYNNATGNTLTTGNRASASLAVVPGFYYFSNPNGASNRNVTGGQWKPVGDTKPGDNLGNHSATQDLALNSRELRLAAANNANHALAYNSAVDGPRLRGNIGGALGTANGTNALQWDNTGKVTLPNATSRLQFANSVANKKFVLYENAANDDNQFYGFGINNATLRYQVPLPGASHVFYAGTSATASNEIFRINGDGNAFMAGEAYSGINRWFRVRGTSGIYWENFGGGWWMADPTWIRVYNGKGILANNTLQIGEGRGFAQLNPGAASNTGHFSVHRTDGTRLGYIGWDNSNFTYVSENGASHVFAGGAVGIGKTPVRSLDVNANNAPVRITSLPKTTNTREVLGIDDAGDIRAVAPTPVTPVWAGGNFASTGNESVIWCINNASVTIPVPNSNQIGKSMSIVATIGDVSLNGAQVVRSNAAYITTIPGGRRITIFAVAAYTFGNPNACWVVTAKDF